ncbi:MAG: YtxH domain-containing protein [Armatimonadetes bacterium]|nr:YtxH domain-containing protein [Armatimonadota bacterium]
MSEERDRLSETVRMIGAGLVGAVIAGGLALLLAPKAGKELREELKGTASEATEKLSEATHTIAGRLKEKAVEIKDKATSVARQAMEQVQQETCEDKPEETGG